MASAYPFDDMAERPLSNPRLSAWTIGHGRHQFGRYARREDAEEEARRRWPTHTSLKIFEVWLNPRERVIVEPVCQLCGDDVPNLAGRVVAKSASVICHECANPGFGSVEPTVVESWPVEVGYVNADGRFEVYREASKQRTFTADYRFKDTTIEVSRWPGVSTLVMAGDIGYVRLELPADVATDLGLRLKEILMSNVAIPFAHWLRGSLRDDAARPSPFIRFEAAFERCDAVSIDVQFAEGRVRLALESALSYVVLTMEDAVAFKLWRALHPAVV